jgi:dolichyl-phosphate beta-glucosyltransferase
MKNEHISLSIVIPAYNEEPNLATTLEDIAGYFRLNPCEFEIIVVDDGSSDKTYDIAKKNLTLFKDFTLLKNERNSGKGYSVKKGVLAATGDLVLFMDADNATRIDQLPNLKDGLEKIGAQIAIASRRIPGAKIDVKQPFYRIFLGSIYIFLSAAILGVRVKDYNCGFKLFKNDAAKHLFSRLTRNDWSFDSELLFLASKFKFKIAEVPVRWEDKKTSKVKPLIDGIKSFLSLIQIKAHHSF